VKNAITLFHAPSNPASTRILSILERSAAPAAASDKSKDNASITLDVTEGPPTADQLRSILEFVGASKAGDLVEGAADEADAQRRIRLNGSSFKRPTVRLSVMLSSRIAGLQYMLDAEDAGVGDPAASPDNWEHG
jgi:Protein of unknown function (DUF1687)